MSSVTRLHHSLPLPADVGVAVKDLDDALVQAIKAAKAAGLPQGLIVSLLHGHAHCETATMVAR
ncbi:hypothetical protein [Pseudomonas sp. Irchel s3f7]|uniref:hypothetical protein n=1 Tax=Pseudomonas sp. Irchel s3f7 TaxID=2009153 RepID=UPI000BA3D315|nr:hypothetical protein [Pseudomonas sp. Irchel s3f7]